MPKTTAGRLGCVGLIIVMLGLCVGGLFLGGIINQDSELPAISLAAEKIRLPFEIPFLGHELPNTFPATWLTMLLLIVVAILGTRKMKMVPSGLQNLIEAIVETFYNFIEGVAGDRTRLFFPLIATFFFFILVSNWLGLLPGFGSVGVYEEHHGHTVLVPFFRSANADLNTTIALALVSVAATQYFGLRTQGVKYLRKFFTFKGATFYEKPINTFVGILELISEFIKILSFSFRLFGNIFAGEVLLIVMAFLAAFIASLPFMGLELFVGIVQALIFAMLSLVFFLMATVSHDEHESH
jgi:F-type H+-transporting ATPase subunit a